MKHCGSFGHDKRKATFKRNSLRDPSVTIYMCHECKDSFDNMPNSEAHLPNIRELKVPGHDG